MGACRSGVASCVGGVLGPCVGAIGPSTESCNGVDDDCNGIVDDPQVLGQVTCSTGACTGTANACVNGKPGTCVAGANPSAEICDGIDNDCNGAIDEVGCSCIYVSPTGLDSNPGTGVAPLLTINAAIALSASDAGLPKIVCVASGLACPSTANYPEAVAMKSGVSVYGGYQQVLITDGGSWPRTAGCITRITAQNAKGVVFDSTVIRPTILDGFDVRAANLPTNAAITVEGSTGAVINANVITGNGGLVSSGIEVVSSGNLKATPQISLNTIVGGTGANQSIGVHALGSAPKITLNCSTFDNAGRCTSFCGAALANPRSIRGRAANNTGAESYGVWLESSPGAIVQDSMICSSPSTRNSAAVRLTGDATGTIVRTSAIDGDNGAINSVGLLAEPCGGAAPWVFNNARVGARSNVLNSRADGIRAIGDCHVRVDSNQLVVGGEESANNDAIGVFCARDFDAGISSQCTVLNNVDILGSAGGIPPSSVGVRCDDGACARISNNRISGRQGQFSAGVVLGNTSAVVDRNNILAGCGWNTGVGLLSRNSSARVENNVIRGIQCGAGMNPPSPQTSYAVQDFLSPGINELDLHSNDLFAEGLATACVSRGLAFDLSSAAGPAGPRGIVRNNIIHAGRCQTTLAVHEMNASAEPRLFENNDLVSGDAGVLYRDENATSHATAGAVNAMTDISSASNLSADPVFDGGIHLAPSSPCRNAGTSAGAPKVDFENDARPQETAPDVGADEYVP
jgi:hypothetical protein